MEQVQPLLEGFVQAIKPDSFADILLYLIFFLAMITSATLPDDSAQASNLLYGTLFLAIFDLTVGQEWYNLGIEKAFPAFLARVGLFLLPFIAAGSVRVKGKKGRMGMPLAIVIGVIGLMYALGSFVVPDIMFAVRF
jgi:hypothetical protein